MNSDNFLVIQDFKKKIIRWRVVTFLCLVSIILISAKNLFSKRFKNGYVARITIDEILTSNSFSNKKLKELEKKEVVGVILNINSPGGEVTASERLYLFFRNLANKKPLVSVIGGSGTSGAYMVAMASNYIIASNTSVVGSIGVMLQSGEITELADKIGIRFTNFKSSPLKATPNPFEKITPDVEMTTSQLIEDMYDYFLSIFIERRNIGAIEAQEIANGQVYSGRQGLEFGLIDKIGGENDALEYFRDNGLDMDKIEVVDFDVKNRDGFLTLVKRHLFGKSGAFSLYMRNSLFDVADGILKNWRKVMAVCR